MGARKLNNEYLNTYNTLTDAIISIFNSKDSKYYPWFSFNSDNTYKS